MDLNPEEQDLILTLLSHLGIDQDRVHIEQSDDTVNVTVDIDPQDAGIYIGRFASTIDSIQLIISLMLNRGDDHRHIHLDIGGYRERRTSTLEQMVDRVSQEVLDSGLARALPPISSTERRQVHLMLSENDKLTTYSQGDGRDRRLFIAPRTD